MATQKLKKKNLLILYREAEKKHLTLVCFLLPIKREEKKKHLTLAA